MPTCITRCASPPGGSSSPSSSKEVGSPGDVELVRQLGDVGPSGTEGRRLAPRPEKQGSRDGASAEQGSSFRVGGRERQDYEGPVLQEGMPHTDFSQTSATAQQV